MAKATNEQICNAFFANDGLNFSGRVDNKGQSSWAANKELLLSDNNTDLRNELFSAIVNKVGLTRLHPRKLENPLRFLYRENMPAGKFKEDIASDIVKGETRSIIPEGKSGDPYKVQRGDTKAAYQQEITQKKYLITIDDAELQYAFLNEFGLANFINDKLSVPVDSATADRFLLAKKMFMNAITSAVAPLQDTQTITVPDIRKENVSDAEVKQAILAIKRVCAKMKFNSRKFNASGRATAAMGKLYFCWSSDAAAANEVMTLSSAYNPNYLSLNTDLMQLDDFGEGGENIIGIIHAERAFEIHNQKYTMKAQQDNGDLYTNYFLHDWNLWAFSPFDNVVVVKAAS